MNLGFYIKDIVYEDNVNILVYSKIEDIGSFTKKIVDITSDKCEIVLGEEFYLSEENGIIIE